MCHDSRRDVLTFSNIGSYSDLYLYFIQLSIHSKVYFINIIELQIGVCYIVMFFTIFESPQW